MQENVLPKRTVESWLSDDWADDFGMKQQNEKRVLEFDCRHPCWLWGDRGDFGALQ